MLTRVLAVSVALLAAIVVYQHTQIRQLRADLADAQMHVVQARSMVADWMEGTGVEIQRTIVWLSDFYKSEDGLQRPDGSWIGGHPDVEGIRVWVFDVYLRRRLKGDSEEQARRAVEDGIKQSDEWRAKHRANS